MTNGNHQRWLANHEPAGGHKAGRRKVSDDDVRLIRRELMAGRKHREIVADHGFPKGTVERISAGISFCWVADEPDVRR